MTTQSEILRQIDSSPPVDPNAWRRGLLALPIEARRAWATRVAELASLGSVDSAVKRVGPRAYAEVEPHGLPWRDVVATWPIERRRRFARMAADLAESGVAHPGDERRAFLIVAAEDDPPGIEHRDPVAAMLSVAG